MTEQIEIQRFGTAWGDLILGARAGALCLCDWVDRTDRGAIDARIQRSFNAVYIDRENPLLSSAIEQLEAYLRYRQKQFDIPLRTAGTPFQQRVWAQLQKVPYGTTLSYARLAESIGQPRAVRAVAAANGANALSIIIPCHRIVGSDGGLTGYAGGLRAKAGLLALESASAKK